MDVHHGAIWSSSQIRWILVGLAELEWQLHQDCCANKDNKNTKPNPPPKTSGSWVWCLYFRNWSKVAQKWALGTKLGNFTIPKSDSTSGSLQPILVPLWVQKWVQKWFLGTIFGTYMGPKVVPKVVPWNHFWNNGQSFGPTFGTTFGTTFGGTPMFSAE